MFRNIHSDKEIKFDSNHIIIIDVKLIKQHDDLRKIFLVWNQEIIYRNVKSKMLAGEV